MSIRPVKPEDETLVAGYHVELATHITSLFEGLVDSFTGKSSTEISAAKETLRASLTELADEVTESGTEDQLDKIAAGVAVIGKLDDLEVAAQEAESAHAEKLARVKASLAPRTVVTEATDEDGTRHVTTIVAEGDKLAASTRAARVFTAESVARVTAAVSTVENVTVTEVSPEIDVVPAVEFVRPRTVATSLITGSTQAGTQIAFGESVPDIDGLATAMAAAFKKTGDASKEYAFRVDYLAGVDENMRVKAGDENASHNERVLASLKDLRSTASGSFENVVKALTDGVANGDRIMASMAESGDQERISAAAALCLPGVFDYGQRVCTTDVRPLENCGLFEMVPLSGDGAWPLNWYKARTLADVTPLPVGVEGKDCPDGTPSDKDCYTLAPGCEPVKQCKDVCAKYTCFEFSNFDLLTWRARLESELELLRAATSRARETELLDFMWKNSHNYISPTLYNSLSGFLSGFIQLIEGRMGTARLDRSGVQGVLYMPSWVPNYLAGALDMIPSQFRPNSLMNVNTPADIDRYFGSLPGVSRVCYFIDNYSAAATGATSQLYVPPAANLGLAPIALPGHPAKFTVGFAPDNAFRKLYRGSIDYGFNGGLDAAVMSPSTLRKNKRFMFSEEFYGLCVGPAADCFAPFTQTVTLCDDGGWAPAAAVRKCFASTVA